MRQVLDWGGVVTLILAVIILGELPVMQELHQYLKHHEFWWLFSAGAAVVVGFVLMMGGILDLIMTRGEPTSHEDAEDLSRSVNLAAYPTTWRATAYRIWGKTAGFEAHDEFSFRAMKDAWRSGAWRRETVWRRRFVVTAGGLMTLVGGFGLAFVLGPPSIKVLAAGALLYALARTAWGFWRA